jgi:hypothetical protein
MRRSINTSATSDIPRGARNRALTLLEAAPLTAMVDDGWPVDDVTVRGLQAARPWRAVPAAAALATARWRL